MTRVDEGYFCKSRQEADGPIQPETLPDNIQREVDWIKATTSTDPVAAAEHAVRIAKANPSMTDIILAALV